MKFNSRECTQCDGHGNTDEMIKLFKDGSSIRGVCPYCSGEGIEYIISPKQLREYKNLKGYVDYHKPMATSMKDWLEIKRQEDFDRVS